MTAGQAPEKTGRANDEYKIAFLKAMKNKKSFEVLNAWQIGTDSKGGYLVPDEFESTLIVSLNDENIIRSLANVINTLFGDKKIPVVASKGIASWTDEEAQITESGGVFGIVTISTHKLTTMIKVSEELLNDSVFNLEKYIAREFDRRIGRTEEKVFANISKGTFVEPNKLTFDGWLQTWLENYAKHISSRPPAQITMAILTGRLQDFLAKQICRPSRRIACSSLWEA